MQVFSPQVLQIAGSRKTTWSAKPAIACTLPPISSASCCVTSSRPSKWNLRPAARRHQRVVQRARRRAEACASRSASAASTPATLRGEKRRICSCADGICPPSESFPSRESGQRHADHARARARRWNPLRAFSGLLGLALQRACAASRNVGGVEVLLREGLVRAQQLHHCVGQLHAGGPRLVHAGVGEHIGAARALADARESIAGQERLAVLARLLQATSRPTSAACRPSR